MQEALVACDQDKLTSLINSALAEDTPAADILNKGLIAGMDIVGDKMENGDMFIPEVLMSAQTMGACLEILKPLLGDDGVWAVMEHKTGLRMQSTNKSRHYRT